MRDRRPAQTARADVVTVVTPALDASRFIGETLRSVRTQTYADVEHIVVDGGSTDGTQALVREAGAARLLDAPGARQADAINRGVEAARGSVVVVLNADDVLYPDALRDLAGALDDDPGAGVVYGEALHIDEHGAPISPYPTRPFEPGSLAESCYICQPAAAVRREVFLAVGGMDQRLDFALDYDFWIRLSRVTRFRKIDAVVAASRMHHGAKTLARRDRVYREVIATLRAHFGYVPYTWAFAYADWLIERTDQFYTPPRRPRLAVLFSLAVGLRLNPRHPLRYLRDWYEHRALGHRR